MSEQERLEYLEQRRAEDHDAEERAVEYLQNAIRDGQAAQLMADLNKLDEVVRLLGIGEEFRSPADEIRRRFGDQL